MKAMKPAGKKKLYFLLFQLLIKLECLAYGGDKQRKFR